VTTVAKIIARSLRLIGVHDPGEPLAADDVETGMEVLNAMCTRWEANGNAFGWRNVSNPSDEMPSPPELDACIAFNLALELAAEYDASVRQDVAARAAELLADLRRDVAVAAPIEPVLDVPTPSGVTGASRLGFPGDWYGGS
jgi:hypothetical protein